MFKRYAFAFAGILLGSTPLLAQETLQVQRQEIIIPQEEFIAYSGPFQEAFPEGFPIGIGSGMCYIGTDKEGNPLFFAVADRGPNADGPVFEEKDGTSRPAKIFPAPDFIPRYGVLSVTEKGTKLVDTTLIRTGRNDPTSGLPLPEGLVGSTGEVPVTETIEVQQVSPLGLDLEGVDIDPADGSLWMCDEYGPFLIHVERDSGRILDTYAPGKGLPEILAKRQPNRGLEGLAITPDRKIILAVQSILDVDGKVKKSTSPFIRLVSFDPATGKCATYAYPHDRAAYKRSRDAKIGDLCALDNHRILLAEQGNGKEGMRNLVYLVDLSKATDITGLTTASGEPLEKTASLEELEKLGVVPAAKRLVCDLRELGWTPDKAEGMALLGDGKTLAICSDNDFGLVASLENPDKESENIGDYATRGEGTLFLKGNLTKTSVQLRATGENSLLWLIALPDSWSEK